MINSTSLSAKKILVAVTGSIAAVKAPILVSRLIKAGVEVKCVITQSAGKLVSPLSLSTTLMMILFLRSTNVLTISLSMIASNCIRS